MVNINYNWESSNYIFITFFVRSRIWWPFIFQYKLSSLKKDVHVDYSIFLTAIA